MRWARRSRAGFDSGGEHASRAALFGIQQGALDKGLRKASADALVDIGFDGYAVGGLAVGEGQEAMFGVLDYAPQQLPSDRPRYLMGVGKPDDIVGAVERGFHYLAQYPGIGGKLLFAVCPIAVFMAGTRILDSIDAERKAG